MQVNFNALQQASPFAKAAAANNSRQAAIVHNGGAQKNKDRADLSPQGKMMNRIEQMIKQKEAIIAKKGELVSQTLESGKSLKVIDEQLKYYEEQISKIDEQIEQATTTMLEAVTEKTDKKKPGTSSSKLKTEEQQETEALSKIATVSDGIKQAQVVSAVRKDVDGEIRVTTAEMKSSEFEIDILNSRALRGAKVENMVSNIKSMLHDKKETLSQLQEQVTELISDQGDKLREVSDSLTESSKDAPVPPELSASPEEFVSREGIERSEASATQNEPQEN